MHSKVIWIMLIGVLTSCCIANLNAMDISAMSSFFSDKTISCYKCNTLTSSACKNITSRVKHDKLIEECGPKAKGCVKQEVQKFDGSKVTFRECYYASVSTFLFTSFACEKIERTASYEKALCYKCSGNLCNSGNRLFTTLSIWLNILLFIMVSFLLRV